MDGISRSTLLNKAWILHCLITGSRLILTAPGWSNWQQAYDWIKQADKSELDAMQVNESWITKSESGVTHSFYLLVVVGVILDVLVLCRRSLASMLFYYELVWTLLFSLTPVAMGALAAKQTFAMLIV